LFKSKKGLSKSLFLKAQEAEGEKQQNEDFFFLRSFLLLYNNTSLLLFTIWRCNDDPFPFRWFSGLPLLQFQLPFFPDNQRNVEQNHWKSKEDEIVGANKSINYKRNSSEGKYQPSITKKEDI